MALWPFGKKKGGDAARSVSPAETPQEQDTAVEQAQDVPVGAPGNSSATTPIPTHDAVSGDTGPFDGDSVNIADFDFSDFSAGVLNLGSMQIPLPKESQVQVEMGDQGPKMLHIVTRHGRITPVAFAAPRSAGQWEEASGEISEGMERDGLTVRTEPGPWGPEIVGEGPNGIIRIIGVDGPRWMLRMTLAAPEASATDLLTLAREVTARTFVYRGDNPILAGSSLPVALPQELVNQVQQAMQQRAGQQQQQQTAGAPAGGSAGAPGATPPTPDERQAVDEAARSLRDLGGDSASQVDPPQK